MATITVKNVPDDLYDKLKALAKEHRRSINNEVIMIIESHLEPRERSMEEMLAHARGIRELTTGYKISDEQIDEFKRQGRP